MSAGWLSLFEHDLTIPHKVLLTAGQFFCFVPDNDVFNAHSLPSAELAVPSVKLGIDSSKYGLDAISCQFLLRRGPHAESGSAHENAPG